MTKEEITRLLEDAVEWYDRLYLMEATPANTAPFVCGPNTNAISHIIAALRQCLEQMERIESMKAIVEASCDCKASGSCGGYCSKRQILTAFAALEGKRE